MKMGPGKTELTLSEAMQVTGLSRGAVWAWASKGYVAHRRQGVRRDIFFDAAALRAFCAEYGYPYDADVAARLLALHQS